MLLRQHLSATREHCQIAASQGIPPPQNILYLQGYHTETSLTVSSNKEQKTTASTAIPKCVKGLGRETYYSTQNLTRKFTHHL